LTVRHEQVDVKAIIDDSDDEDAVEVVVSQRAAPAAKVAPPAPAPAPSSSESSIMIAPAVLGPCRSSAGVDGLRMMAPARSPGPRPEASPPPPPPPPKRNEDVQADYSIDLDDGFDATCSGEEGETIA
jgi:hypothetical protein